MQLKFLMTPHGHGHRHGRFWKGDSLEEKKVNKHKRCTIINCSSRFVMVSCDLLGNILQLQAVNECTRNLHVIPGSYNHKKYYGQNRWPLRHDGDVFAFECFKRSDRQYEWNVWNYNIQFARLCAEQSVTNVFRWFWIMDLDHQKRSSEILLVLILERQERKISNLIFRCTFEWM